MESLIKRTEHALNVTQGKKTTQNKIKAMSSLFQKKQTQKVSSFLFQELALGHKVLAMDRNLPMY